MSFEDREEISKLVELTQSELPDRTRAFEQLVVKIYPDVLRLAISIVANREDAEQVAQDALTTTFHKISTVKNPVAFQKWLSTVVLNTARNFLTREQREQEKRRLYSAEAPEFVEVKESDDRFTEMIAGLSTLDRTIVALRLIQEFEFSEIAVIVDLQVNTTKMRYYRALEKLSESYQGK